MRIALGVAAWVLIAAGLLTLYSHWRVRQWENASRPAGKMVQVGDLSLHYIEEGQGQPVVFLHGGILSSIDFAQAVDIAARRGYRAIAFDRPGYGHSQRPAAPATPIVQARLLRQALEVLGAERPIIVAHSYSGSLAMVYALEYPRELAGLVLVGAAVYGGSMYPAGYGDPLSRLVATPIAGDLFLNTLFVPLATVAIPKMVEQTFAPDPAPREYVERALALWGRPGQFRANREDILYFSPTMDALKDRFPQIETPIVFIYGERDPFGVDQHARKLSRTLSQVKTIVVPGAGHMLPVVHPQAVVDAIDELKNADANHDERSCTSCNES